VPDEFLTVAQIAELLKLNPQTVRNMIDRGELPAVRVGSRRVRVRRSELDRFLEAGATGRLDAGSQESLSRSAAGRPDRLTCPVWHAGELIPMDGPPEWYVLPAATLGLPDDAEKRVGRGVPVGVSVCSRCQYVALFLPPTIS
jgi:excisionase family DNA binding protein